MICKALDFIYFYKIKIDIGDTQFEIYIMKTVVSDILVLYMTGF